jgi:hypothetical protein
MELAHLVFLSPGVFVQKMKEIDKVFPIEIFVGGNVGNNGIKESFYQNGNHNGTFTLYFETAEN